MDSRCGANGRAMLFCPSETGSNSRSAQASLLLNFIDRVGLLCKTLFGIKNFARFMVVVPST